MIVTRLLNSKTPLIAQLDLADGLCAPGTVDLAGGRITLLGGAGVLDAATVANEIVPSGLAVAVVGGAELHDTIALILGDALNRAEKILKVSENALGRRQEGRGRGVWHRDRGVHLASIERVPLGRRGERRWPRGRDELEAGIALSWLT